MVIGRLVQFKNRKRRVVDVVCPSCNKLRTVCADSNKQSKSALCYNCSSTRSGNKTKTGKFFSCLRCGKLFWVIPARFHHSKYCSKTCQNYIKERNCASCMKSFKPKYDKAVYCSSKCFGIGRMKRINYQCGTCGKTYLTLQNTPKKFCSKTCQMNRPVIDKPNYRNGKYANKSHPYPYGGKWPSIRKFILNRDNHRCQYPSCNSSMRLQVHHKTRFDDKHDKDFQNDPNNLITLCIFHHQELHRIK